MGDILIKTSQQGDQYRLECFDSGHLVAMSSGRTVKEAALALVCTVTRIASKTEDMLKDMGAVTQGEICDALMAKLPDLA